MQLPKIIESPDFQKSLEENLDRFTELAREKIAGFNRPTPADPAYHLIVEMTLLRVIISEKINAAAYAQLIKLSNDLEFIFKGKLRSGESYEAFRDRMRGTKYLASPAGTVAMYKALTFLYGEATLGTGKDVRSASVQDAYVQASGGALLVHVLMSSDAPDLKAAVIAALTEAFKKEAVKPALDSVTFRAALTTPFSIAATISLMPGFGEDHRAAIEKNFRAKFEAEKRLGWVPTVSWIIKELHQTGVRSVILRSPVSNIPVQPERYAVISTLDLTMETSA
jgi:phage-related baseplate assembly protein